MIPNDATAYIAAVRWQFAKTMPDWPHEYTVKSWNRELAAKFEAFCQYIEDQGAVEPWPPPPAQPIYHNRYLVVGDHKYWAMGPQGDSDAVPDKTVINRQAWPLSAVESTIEASRAPGYPRESGETSAPVNESWHDSRMKPQNTVLLEQLAATGWFAEHGEVALTSGLAFCLEKDSEAAGGFMELLRQRTGHTADTLPMPDLWRAELADDDHNRVDLAGLVLNEGGQAPVLFLEAKVSAKFAPQQVSGYVQTQQQSLRVAGAEAGVMVVLVPEDRRRAAGEEVALDLARLDVTTNDSCWILSDGPAVTVCVISWDDAIDAMLGPGGSATCDLEQLRGACRALRGADVLALTEEDLAGGWLARSEDLRLIIDRVTRRAIAELSLPLAPWQPNSSGGLAGGFRYLAPDDLPNLAVGLRLDEKTPPFWVRWHHDTPDFTAVPSRLVAAGYTVEEHEGHLWSLLALTPDVGTATRQIDSLVAQVVKLHKAATDWSEPV